MVGHSVDLRVLVIPRQLLIVGSGWATSFGQLLTGRAILSTGVSGLSILVTFILAGWYVSFDRITKVIRISYNTEKTICILAEYS